MASVKLTWTNPSDTDLQGVRVYRKIGAGADTIIGALTQDPATPSASIDIDDVTAVEDELHTYTVRPYDADGNQEAGVAVVGENRAIITPVASLNDVFDKYSAMSLHERMDSKNGLTIAFGYATTSVVLTLDQTEQRAGNGCLKAVSVAANSKIGFWFNHDLMEVGGVYTLKLWYKSTAPSASLDQILGWLGFCNFPSSMTITPVSTTWTEVTFTGLVYSNQDNALYKPHFQFNIGEAGKNIFVDSVTCVKTAQLTEESGTNLLAACCTNPGSALTTISATNWTPSAGTYVLSANNSDITPISGEGYYLKAVATGSNYVDSIDMNIPVVAGEYYKIELNIYSSSNTVKIYPSTNFEPCWTINAGLKQNDVGAWETNDIVFILKASATGTGKIKIPLSSASGGSATGYIDRARVTKVI